MADLIPAGLVAVIALTSAQPSPAPEAPGLIACQIDCGTDGPQFAQWLRGQRCPLLPLPFPLFVDVDAWERWCRPRQALMRC